MTISRRQFLTRGAAGAAGLAAGPHLNWVPGTNVSYAAGPSDAIVVVVQLNGGNDGINTVYPLNGTQRTTYEAFRPTLQLPNSVGGITSKGYAGAGYDVSKGVLDTGTNPDGNDYALHPVMKTFHDLYEDGDLAIVNGVHYPFADYSHFRSEVIYYTGNPLGTGGQGWLGRYLDFAGFPATAVPGVNIGSSYNPLFTPTGTSLFAFSDLSSLNFPASALLEEKKAAFRALYLQSGMGNPADIPELVALGNTGVATIDTIEEYFLPGTGNTGKVEGLLIDENERYSSRNPLVYDSPLNEDNSPQLTGIRLARDLRHVAATIRSDVGARFFHVRVGGFDTHSAQEKGFNHSRLLHSVSEAVGQFYRDMQSTVTMPAGYTGYLDGDLSSKVLIVTLSEFGRTAQQNAQGADSAGTDHATSGPQFVIGSAVNGGHFGAYPMLNDPLMNDENDLATVTDYRDLYGTMLERWLGVPASEIDPSTGSFFAATPADSFGFEWASYNPIGYLSP